MIELSIKRPSIFYSAVTEVLSFQDKTSVNIQVLDTEQIYFDTLFWGKYAASKKQAVRAVSRQPWPNERQSSSFPTVLTDPQKQWHILIDCNLLRQDQIPQLHWKPLPLTLGAVFSAFSYLFIGLLVLYSLHQVRYCRPCWENLYL